MTLVHSGKSPDAKAEPEKETAAYAFKLFTTLHHGKCLAVPARCADWSSFLGSGKQKARATAGWFNAASSISLHIFPFSPKIALRCITIDGMAAHFRAFVSGPAFLHDFAGAWRCAPHVFCGMNNNFPGKQPNSTGSCSNCQFYPIAWASVHIWNCLDC